MFFPSGTWVAVTRVVGSSIFDQLGAKQIPEEAE